MPKVLKVAQLVNLATPATASTTAITAAFGGDATGIDPVTVTGATITQPDMARNVTATFGANWGATNHITVYGTDINNAAISEVLTSNPNGVTTGAKAFKTVTKVTKVKQDTVNGTNTCSIGTGVLFGVAGKIADTFAIGHLIGTGFDPVVVSTTNSTVTTTTAPNASRSWNVLINLQA